MKRDWARLFAIGGAVLIIQSVLWEYARMQPDNNYFIDPWAFRGYQSVHGLVFATIGIALLAAVAFLVGKSSESTRASLTAVAGMALAGWLIALAFAGSHDVTLSGDSVVAILLAVVVALIVIHGVNRIVEAEVDIRDGRTQTLFKVGTGVWIAATVALLATSGILAGVYLVLVGGLAFVYGVLRTIQAGRISWTNVPRIVISLTRLLTAIGIILLVVLIVRRIIGDERTLPAHVAVLIGMAILGTLTSIMKTPSMAANRMLIVSSVVAGSAIGFSGGAIRSTLFRLQEETGPLFLPGQYRDTQVTWGYFLANIGVVVLFIGTVMLWARRRDIVQAQQRAAKQRAAARDSAAEIAKAT